MYVCETYVECLICIAQFVEVFRAGVALLEIVCAPLICTINGRQRCSRVVAGVVNRTDWRMDGLHGAAESSPASANELAE